MSAGGMGGGRTRSQPREGQGWGQGNGLPAGEDATSGCHFWGRVSKGLWPYRQGQAHSDSELLLVLPQVPSLSTLTLGALPAKSGPPPAHGASCQGPCGAPTRAPSTLRGWHPQAAKWRRPHVGGWGGEPAGQLSC